MTAPGYLTPRAEPSPRGAATLRWVATHPRLDGTRRAFRQVGGPRLVLAAGMGLFFATFSVLTYWRHDRYGTFDFDLAIFDQSTWLIARGEGFITVRGLETWGHHANFAHYLFAPFYWLGAGPEFLNLAMVGAVALASAVIYRLANRRLGDGWLAVVLALAFLAQPTTSWLMQETYHPEVMAILPFFLAYDAADRGRWWPFAIWVALAVAWKEDVAMATMMLGCILAVRGQRRAGVLTFVASLAYLLLITRVVIPHYSPGGVFFEDFYGHLGESPTDMAVNVVSDPSLVTDQLGEANASGYTGELLAGYGFTSLLSPLTLLIALPQWTANLLAQQSFHWSTHFHYTAMILAGSTLAMVEGIGRRARIGARRFLVGLVAVSAVATSIAWGVGPLGQEYETGYWPLEPNQRQVMLDLAVSLPGGSDSVAATYNLVPHLAHRSNIYTFPNPWQPSNWGVHDENTHDPDLVEWLVIDRSALGPEQRELLDGLIAGGEWTLELDTGNIVVAHRA